MQPDWPKHLEDIRDAAAFVLEDDRESELVDPGCEGATTSPSGTRADPTSPLRFASSL